MGLVEYPDSTTESESEALLVVSAPPKKKSRQSTGDAPKRTTLLPSLPTAFHDLYASSIRVSVRDDPTLHGGRKRVIPHVEGNWPTHIYLEWYPEREELSILADVLSKCQKLSNCGASNICSLLHSDLGVQLPLHISLSRPVVLSTEQKQPFMENFDQTIHSLNTGSFTVTASTLDWVSNFEETRWFLVLRLRKPQGNELNKLLRVSNQTLAVFGQPPLYASQKQAHRRDMDAACLEEEQKDQKWDGNRYGDFTNYFHISLAWSLTGPSSEEEQRVSHMNLDRLGLLEIPFRCVKAKIGNFVHSLEL